jgi:hypothetical protein
MPFSPVTFASGQPPTAKQLNTALYTYTPGSNFTPNGILFHANRPTLVEGLRVVLSQSSSATGVITSLSGSANWRNYFDNGALFGGAADNAFDTAFGTLNPVVSGSSGTATTTGGYYVIWGFPNFGATTNAGGSGSYLNVNGTAVSGGKQLSSTTRNNCAYVLDLVNVTSGQFTSLEGWCSDTSNNSFAYTINSADYSGSTTRFYGFWAGVLSNGSTINSVPAPPAWSSTSTVTSAALNGAAVGQPMSLLNNPPILRAATNLSGGAVATSALKVVALTTAQVDTYSSWSSGSNSYTVPLSGVYLVHGYVYYSSSAGGNVQAGIYVNSSVVAYGPAYQAGFSNNAGCEVTRLLDLDAGDQSSW